MLVKPTTTELKTICRPDKSSAGTVALNLAGMQLSSLAFLTEYKNIVGY